MTANRDADADELQLSPSVGKSIDELRGELLKERPQHEIEDEDLPGDAERTGAALREFQFRLRDIMLITLVAAVGFGLMPVLPLDFYAGAMGVFVIVGLAFMNAAKPQAAIAHLLWWTLLATYIIVCIVAVATKVS